MLPCAPTQTEVQMPSTTQAEAAEQITPPHIMPIMLIMLSMLRMLIVLGMLIVLSQQA
jgi:hypothetical protein